MISGTSSTVARRQWSVRASTSNPAVAYWRATALGGRSPSLTVEWVCRAHRSHSPARSKTFVSEGIQFHFLSHYYRHADTTPASTERSDEIADERHRFPSAQCALPGIRSPFTVCSITSRRRPWASPAAGPEERHTDRAPVHRPRRQIRVPRWRIRRLPRSPGW